MKTLGQTIREMREVKHWPQRELAYHLDVDVAVLSRIENENKFPKKRLPEILQKLSGLFGVPEDELRMIHLSDEIADLLVHENKYEEILKASEAKVHYERQKNSVQSNLDFDNEGN